MDNTKQSPIILSFYTGLRGLERGLERVFGNITIAAYVEIEAFCIFNLVAQMEQGVVAATPIWTDDKTFPAQHFYGKVHIITGGYPCQPFSISGLRGGADDPRHRWPYLKQAVRAVKPFCCFFENVTGHLTLGFDIVKRELEEIGYRVEAGIYSAEEVGAPHQRKRLYILAILADTYSDGYRARAGETGNKGCQDENKTQGTNREWLRAIIRNSGKAVGVAHCQGLPNGIQQRKRSTAKENETFTRGEFGRTIAETWPMPQGYEQYEWEEPRMVKPGLGVTINGFNFRTDILRALGNGVVEQTAELAFRELLKKHNI